MTNLVISHKNIYREQHCKPSSKTISYIYMATSTYHPLLCLTTCYALCLFYHGWSVLFASAFDFATTPAGLRDRHSSPRNYITSHYTSNTCMLLLRIIITIYPNSHMSIIVAFQLLRCIHFSCMANNGVKLLHKNVKSEQRSSFTS